MKIKPPPPPAGPPLRILNEWTGKTRPITVQLVAKRRWWAMPMMCACVMLRVLPPAWVVRAAYKVEVK